MLIVTLTHLLAGTIAEHLGPIPGLLAGGLRAALVGSVMGAASGMMFWLIAGRSRRVRLHIPRT